MWNKLRVAVVCLLVGVAGFSVQAGAAPLRSTPPPAADCLAYLRPGAAGLVDWRDTVPVEHCDRISRLWRLSSYAAYGAPPEFFDGYIEASRLPVSVGVRMPILRVVFPERVFFDTARSDLRPEALEVVRIVARNLQQEPPDVALFVSGHADERGGRDYNLNLSIDRANAVAQAIADHGVNVASVWRVGFGEDMPLIAGADDNAYGQNRRVEFLFAGRPEVVAAWLEDEQLDMLCQGRTAAEINDCKRTLDALSTSYTAVEVRRSVAALAPRTAPANLNLHDRPVTLDPTPTRRIEITPVNVRRANSRPM